MPHLHLAYDLAAACPTGPGALLLALHRAACAQAAFPADELKSRAAPSEWAIVGSGPLQGPAAAGSRRPPPNELPAAAPADGFVHVTLSLLAGRPSSVLAALADALFAALEQHAATCSHVQAARISVEIREMARPTYRKGRAWGP